MKSDPVQALGQSAQQSLTSNFETTEEKVTRAQEFLGHKSNKGKMKMT